MKADRAENLKPILEIWVFGFFLPLPETVDLSEEMTLF